LSAEQPKLTTFFFDGTHGKLIPQLLKAVGMSVKLHRNQGWRENMLDVDWIAECGKNDWAIITGDKQIHRVPEERQAVIDAKCKVFMFDDSHDTRTEDWAASLLVSRHRLTEIVERTNGPLFVTIKRCKVHGHLTLPDFVLTGGWKPEEAKPIAVASALEGHQKMKPNRKQQTILDFSPRSTALISLRPTNPHCELCAKLFVS
jgi:hypothetical protein